tara:strand:+ start:97 stop:234 length:138 start_codon:yes stop_codon:yes gene_type:complete
LQDSNFDEDLDWIAKSGGFEWTPGSPWPPESPEIEENSERINTKI